MIKRKSHEVGTKKWLLESKEPSYGFKEFSPRPKIFGTKVGHLGIKELLLNSKELVFDSEGASKNGKKKTLLEEVLESTLVPKLNSSKLRSLL